MALLPALLAVLTAAPPLSAAPRPVPVATPAAQVLVLQGGVTVLARGQEFPAAQGVLLEEADTLKVSEGAWVTVQLLDNHHVVRLDDEVTLRVGELALFKAKAASATPEQQLNRLLTPQEQASSGARLIGWHAGMSGVNVRQAQSKEETRAAPPAAPRTSPGRAGGLPSKADSLPPPPPSLPPAVQSGEAPLAKKREVAVPSSRSPPQGQPSPRAGPSTNQTVKLVSDAALSACLRRALQDFGPELLSALGGTIAIDLKRPADGDVRVRLDKGLPTPACARQWATSHRSELPTEWTRLTVPLE